MKIKVSLLDLLDLGAVIYQVTGKMEAIRILNVRFPLATFARAGIKIEDQFMDFYEDDLTVVWDIVSNPAYVMAVEQAGLPFTVLEA